MQPRSSCGRESSATRLRWEQSTGRVVTAMWQPYIFSATKGIASQAKRVHPKYFYNRYMFHAKGIQIRAVLCYYSIDLLIPIEIDFVILADRLSMVRDK